MMQYNESESDFLREMNGESQDYNAYQEAQKYDTLESYKSYLSKYPDGMWNEKATKKIDELEKKLEEKKRQEEEAKRLRELEEQKRKEEEEKRKIEEENKRDQDAYSEAQKKGTIKSFRSYINEFPNGQFILGAKTHIERLLNEKRNRIEAEQRRLEEIKKKRERARTN